MTLFADKVKESTSTGGVGVMNLGGAVAGPFTTFVAGVGTGNRCYYVIEDPDWGRWEAGIGTVTAGTPDTLSRDFVIRSSDGPGVAVAFGTNPKTVYCSALAEVAGEFTPYTPTGSWVANTAYSEGFWSIAGDEITMVGRLDLTGAPTAAQLWIYPPAGFNFDPGKIPVSGRAWVGTAVLFDSSAGAHYLGNAVSFDPTYAAMWFIPQSGSLFQTFSGVITNVAPFAWGAGDWLTWRITVPVVRV